MPARRLTDSPVVRSGRRGRAVGASGRPGERAARWTAPLAGRLPGPASRGRHPKRRRGHQPAAALHAAPAERRRRCAARCRASARVVRQPAAVVEEHPLGVERGEADDSRLRSLPVGGQEGLGRSCGSGRSRPDRRGSGAPRFRNDASIWRWHASPRSPPVLVARSGRSRRDRPVRLARSIVGVHDRTPVMHQRA